MRLDAWNAFLALACVGLGWAAFVGAGGQPAPLEGRLFPELELDRVHALRIEPASGEGRPLLLERIPDGELSASALPGSFAAAGSGGAPAATAGPSAPIAGPTAGPPSGSRVAESGASGRRAANAKWRLPQAFGHPADGDRVLALLDRLRVLGREGRVAERAESHEHYGLGANALRVRVLDEAGEPLFEFLQGGGVMGDETAAGVPAGGGPRRDGANDGAATFVARVDDPAVYRVPRLERLSLEPTDWLRREALVLDVPSVQRVELERAGAVRRFTRVAWDRWEADGAASNDAPATETGTAVRRLLFALEELRIDRVTGAVERERRSAPEDETDGAERLRLRLTLDSGLALELELGPRDEDGRRSLRTAEGRWRVRVDARSCRRLQDALDGLR